MRQKCYRNKRIFTRCGADSTSVPTSRWSSHHYAAIVMTDITSFHTDISRESIYSKMIRIYSEG
jgi:hypothetical protein